LFRDFSLIRQICFVAYEDDNDICASFSTDIVDPFAGLFEGFGVCGELLVRVGGKREKVPYS